MEAKVSTDFWYRSDTFDKAIVENVLLRKTEYFLPNFEPKIILDFGANIGAATRLIREAYPNATIHAVEPDGENFEYLIKNTQGDKSTCVYNFALSDKNGEKRLYHSDNPKNKGGFSFFEVGSNKNESVNVITRNARDFVSSILMPGEVVDLMKIDVEGAEFEIIKALGDLLPHRIIGEAHGIKDFEMFRLLSDRGFRLAISKPLTDRNYRFYAEKI